MDSLENNRRVVEKLALDYPVLSDPDAKTITAFGVLHAQGGMGSVDIARPAAFLIDGDGVVRWRHLTDNWRIRLRPESVIEAIRQTR